MPLQSVKDRLRQEMARAAQAMTQEERASASGKIAAAVLQSEIYRQARSVFVYISMPQEPDTQAILRHALDHGKRVYVPKCYPPHRMEAVRIRDMSGMIPGVWNIPEPSDCHECADRVDLAIVPCVTASLDGKRLGHGAGYYDRFLLRHGTASVCLCFQDMLRRDIPMNEYDAWMDCVVTEQGLIRCGA